MPAVITVYVFVITIIYSSMGGIVYVLVILIGFERIVVNDISSCQILRTQSALPTYRKQDPPITKLDIFAHDCGRGRGATNFSSIGQ